MAQDVLDVLTVKQEDNHPELSMSVQELNEAEGQPTDDSSYEEYTASLLDSASRIELHMDYINEDDNKIQRVVDGRVASYDSTNEEITIQLNRSDTERKGEYLFEWVLVFDGDISSDQATEVQTIPSIGFFALEVKPSSQRNVGEINAVDRRVNDLTVEGIVQTNTVSPFDTNVVTFPEGVAADQLDSDQNNYIEFLSSIGSEANPVPNVTHLEQANIDETDSDSYLLDGSPLAQWTQVDRQTEVTSVQVDTSGYEQVRVIGFVGTTDTLTLTIDNLTDSSYQYTQIDGTSLVESSGQTSFSLTQGGNNMASGFDYTLTNTGVRDKTGIYGNAAAKFASFKTLLRGAYDGSNSSLDSVELSQSDIQLIEVWGR